MSLAETAGPYLGQTPPGMIPELFAPDFLSLGGLETSITFSPDGMSVAWTALTEGGRLLPKPRGPFRTIFILQSHVENGRWTEPREFPFIPHRISRYPAFSPDGTKVFFNLQSERSDAQDTLYTDMWVAERQADGWSTAKEVRFDGEFSGRRVGVYPTVAANGNLYFATFPDRQNGVIHVSRYEGGKYLPPRSLQDELQNHGNHPYIAPDESYLLFDWEHPDEQYGENDILISFRDKDGKWMKAQSLGAAVNSRYHDWRPFVSSDEKYLFFSSNRIDSPELPARPMSAQEVRDLVNVPANGHQHMYWVDARVIAEARQKFSR